MMLVLDRWIGLFAKQSRIAFPIPFFLDHSIGEVGEAD